MPKWLQYYIGGEGSLGTPKSDYVICARPRKEHHLVWLWGVVCFAWKIAGFMVKMSHSHKKWSIEVKSYKHENAPAVSLLVENGFVAVCADHQHCQLGHRRRSLALWPASHSLSPAPTCSPTASRCSRCSHMGVASTPPTQQELGGPAGFYWADSLAINLSLPSGPLCPARLREASPTLAAAAGDPKAETGSSCSARSDVTWRAHSCRWRASWEEEPQDAVAASHPLRHPDRGRPKTHQALHSNSWLQEQFWARLSSWDSLLISHAWSWEKRGRGLETRCQWTTSDFQDGIV